MIDIDMTTSFRLSEGSQATVEIIDQSTDGKVYFDAANGHTTSMKIEQSLTTVVTISGDKINQTIENMTESKFQLVK